MRISINIDGQSIAVSSAKDTNVRAQSATVRNAAKPVFDQDLKEESPSLENRVQRLAKDLNDLTPDQIGEEMKVCEQQLADLTDRIQAMKFTMAFPIVEQLAGGK
jgi:hypothetical protein